jgi:NADH pyrophosphatase NudC (nudix superfamily)
MYAGAPTTRPLDARLEDVAWVEAVRADSACLLIDLERNSAAVDAAGNLAWVSGAQAEAIGDEAVLLGRRSRDAVPSSFLSPRFTQDAQDKHCFGVRTEAAVATEAIGSVAGFVSLRELVVGCSGVEASMAGQARNLIHWHRSHRFCGACGGATALGKGGWKRQCGSCGREHFPRTDPVVIAAVLSRDGQRCLLGKNAAWPARRFSCLAGFLDPGETVEEAVRREVREEAGVRVGEHVFYHSSQPWPNGPSPQLMLGAIAIAETDAICVDPAELEAARWVGMDELRAALATDSTPPEWLRQADAAAEPSLMLPPPLAIAHRLLTACATLDIEVAPDA